MRRDTNLIGRNVARLRYQQGLTQNMLVAIEEKLDLTKNKAPSQVEAADESETNGVSELQVRVRGGAAQIKKAIRV